MNDIVGIHPYADKFPMLPEGELAELAESIRANGLRNPIVITPEGLVLDGRNRLVACERAGVEPVTVVYDGDDLAEYVIDCNVTRRNMTTGARAMSTALVLAADGRRDGGRWKRGSVAITESGNSDQRWRNALNEAGTVLDFAPDLADAVVAADVALDAAYRTACNNRDAERRKLEEQERIAAEEADAKAFVESSAPDLAAQVGDVFESYAEAQAVWEKRNREEAQRIAAEKDEHAFIFDPDRPGVFLRASDLVTDAAGNRVRLGEVVTAQATKAEFVEWLTAFFVGHDASPSGDPVASDSAPAAGGPAKNEPAAGGLPTHESGDA